MMIFRKRPMCWLAIGFLLILLLFLWGRSYKDILYAEESGEVILEGTVTDKQYKESAYGGYWQITLKNVQVVSQESEDTVSVRRAERDLPAGMRKVEAWEGKYLCQIASDKFWDVKMGQRLLLKGTYMPWEEAANPGQFDTGKYYISQGILGQFKKCNMIKQGTEFSTFREEMWRIRQEAHEFLKQELGEDDGSLISAMLLGDKSGLKEDTKNLYQRNGISHILAISGLHLMLLGMGIFQILTIILRSKRRASSVSIIIMSLYCVFTGNSISTIRATIMFALSFIAPSLGRSYDSLSALGLAAILQLFMNPYVLKNSGFLLSFLAVIGVTFLAPKLQELLGAKRKITRSFCVSISSALATLPVLLRNYGTYPWYSVFLNLLILPAMSVLLFLAVVLVLLGGTIAVKIGTIEAATSGAEVILFVLTKAKNIIVFGIKLILKYFETCCKVFEYVPFQDGYIGAPAVWQIVIYACVIALAISGVWKHSAMGRKMMLLSAISILTLHWNVGSEITMLDVGQGDGIVIRNSNGHVYISDCGSSSVSKVGKYRLIPFLKYKGYGKIKGILASHLDEDHMNGIVELLEMAPEEKIEIEYLFLPESVLGMEKDRELVTRLKELTRQNKTNLVYLEQGDMIQDQELKFQCLYPKGSTEVLSTIEEGPTKSISEDRNNQSLVLLVQYKEFEMLLTGDVGKEAEKEILTYIDQIGLYNRNKDFDEFKKLSDKPHVQEGGYGIDVLKVPHHGSSGSSSEEFLEMVNPKLSLISCGKNNSYGHPHEETLERLETVGSEIMTTVESGAITLKIGKKIRVFAFKK